MTLLEAYVAFAPLGMAVVFGAVVVVYRRWLG